MAVPATSFSLTEKLAVAGAFLALVAMAVGTDEDPGVIASVNPDKAADAGETPAAAEPVPLLPPVPTPLPLQPETQSLPPPGPNQPAPSKLGETAPDGGPVIELR